MKLSRGFASLSGALCIVAVPIHAQNTGGSSEALEGLGLEEITVTARRREENLQDTPVAVTAFTGEALEMRAASSVDAVSQFVPNVQFDGAAALSGGAYNATVFIRGIGQNDFAIFSDPGAAMYLDGVYLGRSIGGIMDAIDLQRLEILRGPQGTLFGRNTIGGAVNIVSKQPTQDFEGEISLTGGRFDRFDAKGVVNIPLSDSFAMRITAASINRDGYQRRLTDGKDPGDRDASIGRVQALWDASEAVAVTISLDATRVRQNSAALTLVDVTPVGVPFLNLYNSLVAPTLGIAAPNGVSTVNASWITGDIDTTWAGGPSVNDLDTRGASVTIDWDLGPVSLKSISAYRELEALFARDGDNTPFTFRETINDDDQDQLSQEFQLSGVSFNDRLTWLIGAYYFEEDAEENGKANLALGTYSALEALMLPVGTTWCGLPGPNPRPIAACPPPPLRFGGAGNPNNVGVDVGVDLYTKVANESVAFFGQGTLDITNALSLTAGVRWTQDEKEVVLVHLREASGNYVVGAPGTQDTFTESWSEVTPKLGLELQVTDDALLYVSYAKGYKSGGFNARPLTGIAEVQTPYDPEIVDSYELGAKTSWFDRRVTANLAAFYNEYTDMQLTVNATPQNFVRNAGEAEIKGAELELVARIARGFDINFAAGYLDAKYTELDPQFATLNPPLTIDKELVKAPEWTLSSGLQYSFLVGLGEITLRGDWAYKSKVYHDVFNDPRLAQDAFDLFNAYVSLVSDERRWELAVFGTNLSDERYRISGNSSAGFGLAESTFSPPREWGATVRYRF
jgi:iron complex outermembrane receptor protein